MNDATCVLSGGSRKELEKACVRGRRAAEAACRVAISSLELLADRPPPHLSEGDRDLRRDLRAKRRQLGDEVDRVDLLVGECAYEQWHRLVFARFLAENDLLIHPQYRAPVTLAECEELAGDLEEPDGWAVAGRFAAEILPGIFRLDDPCVRLRLAPEGRLELERIVASLPSEVFVARDALGWVYQFWQKEKKDEANDSERKIGGADLAPVTQLFTDNYMVRFLLENSLGAWWVSRHPNSPLLRTWEYLRFDGDGKPAAGSFDDWPHHVAEVTVIDPCCGSGHFLVEAFGMLWRMRAEEEGLTPVAAQDAVLRDNLFGLELDPRCVQIAMFAVALTAWKAGEGWRQLPVPNVACSGIPVKAPAEEWKALANGHPTLANALVRLHILFADADTLGSLIDPERSVEITDPTGLQKSFEDVAWDDTATLVRGALMREGADPASAVLGADAAGIASAADLLSRRYVLVATNVPFLQKANQSPILRDYSEKFFRSAREDLASTMLERFRSQAATLATVSPMAWLSLGRYSTFREDLLRSERLHLLVRLGARAFEGIAGEVVMATLLVASSGAPRTDETCAGLDASDRREARVKAEALRRQPLTSARQSDIAQNPVSILSLDHEIRGGALLETVARSLGGTTTGDSPRYRRFFWEFPGTPAGWVQQQLTPATTAAFAGRDSLLNLAGVQRAAARGEGVTIAGREAWGKVGVAVRYTGDLPVTLYEGEHFENVIAVIVPLAAEDRPAVWDFCQSAEFLKAVRRLDQKIGVTANTLARVPFDAAFWRQVATASGPLPEAWSNDPTQWLFGGRPEVATGPIQVAVARLLGYRWPEQADSDDLDEQADDDAIVCLPSVLGERTAAGRVQELLARAYGGTWSPSQMAALLGALGSKKDLELWLRDDFFKAHCQMFKNRPFIWHVWDGRKDGFAALLNYHRLNRQALARLTYTYLGDWIERQTAGAREKVVGADERLAAAHDLQRRLELVLAGEPPHDIYVRWKSVAEQPIGWDPDLNDGVRLNVRPFVEAGVLRSKLNVKWDKDRGKNPDGSERPNDLHFTAAQKQSAQGEVRA